MHEEYSLYIIRKMSQNQPLQYAIKSTSPGKEGENLIYRFAILYLKYSVFLQVQDMCRSRKGWAVYIKKKKNE